MRNAHEFRRDDRGVSSTVTHALALGITAILISGLLLAAGTVLEDQRENSAREQLRTVGNRISNDLVRASALAQDGGTVSIRTRQPTRIAGEPYRVTMLTGDACDTELFNTSTNACLALETQSGRTSVMVPVRNETAVQLIESSGGKFNVTATSDTPAPTSPTPEYDVDLRVGVGKDVTEFDPDSSLNHTNPLPPISGFTFSPGQPTVKSKIHFQNDTDDLDGVIMKHEWDLYGDGTIDENVSEFNHSYESPGKYNVTLTVTDDDGQTDSVSKIVSVAGLVYKDPPGASAENVSDSIEHGAIHFSVTNEHSESIYIHQVLIDPLIDPNSGGPEELDSEGDGDPYEILIDGDEDGGFDWDEDGYYDLYDDGLSNDEKDINVGGQIYDIESYGSGDAELSAGDTADIEFNGFENNGVKLDMDDKPVRVAMRYKVEDGAYYTTQFTLFKGGNLPPDPTFTYYCPDLTCEFDPTGSDDPDGTIDEYEWDFGGGNTVTKTSATNVTHMFPANGSYIVSLELTDDQGDSSRITKSIFVGNLPDFAVNSGGEDYPPSGTTVYQADIHFDGGEVHNSGSSISGTPDNELYQTYRESDGFSFDLSCWCFSYDDFSYEIPLENGQYRVTFKFAETYYSADGERIFDVFLEDGRVINDLDVHDSVGHDTALDQTRTVTVNDDELDIEFVSEEGTAMVSAIKIERLDAGP